MTTAAGAGGVARARAFTDGLRIWLWRHPEWWALSLSAAAWGLLARQELARPETMAMDGAHSMAMDGAHSHGHAAGIVSWSLMVLAMMLPLIVGPIRLTAARSLWRRRQRAILEHVAGYVAIWVLAGAVLLAARSGLVAAGWLDGDAPRALAVVGLLGAAARQLTPGKRRALYACHRAAPLAAHDGARTGTVSPTGCPSARAAFEAADP